jgi:hypothetical protein
MKLKDKIILYIGGMLAGGDTIINTRKDEPEPIVINQQKELGSKLMQALKKHEVTQEVAELRWRMYMLDRKMDDYTVVRDHLTGELKAVKKHPEFTKPKVFEEQNKKVVIVQNTEPFQSGVDNGITDGIKLHELHKIKQEFPLKFERTSLTRSEFDKTCYHVVMKQSGKKKIKYYLDFYFNSIPDPYERTKRITTLELQKVFEKKQPVEYIDDWKTVSFTTRNCWGVDNYINYKLENKKFLGIEKWGMFYILQYEVVIADKVDEIQQYYNDNMQKEYDNNTPRPDRYVAHDIITGDDDIGKDEHCDRCGKLMDYKKLEVADYRITEDIFGIGMCKECLKEYLEKNKLI